MKAINSWHDFLATNPILLPLINNISSQTGDFLSFLVDPTTYPNAIHLAQVNQDIDIIGKLCYLTKPDKNLDLYDAQRTPNFTMEQKVKTYF